MQVALGRVDPLFDATMNKNWQPFPCGLSQVALTNLSAVALYTHAAKQVRHCLQLRFHCVSSPKTLPFIAPHSPDTLARSQRWRWPTGTKDTAFLLCCHYIFTAFPCLFTVFSLPCTCSAGAKDAAFPLCFPCLPFSETVPCLAVLFQVPHRGWGGGRLPKGRPALQRPGDLGGARGCRRGRAVEDAGAGKMALITSHCVLTRAIGKKWP